MDTLLKRLSYLAILGFPLSVLGTRMGLFDFRVGFVGVRYTLYLSAVIFLISLVFWFKPREEGDEGYKVARLAALLSLIPIIGIGSQLAMARNVPPIHNISTDTVNPPEFVRVTELRSAGSNPLAYDADQLASVQKAAYPNVRTLVVDISPRESHRIALATARGMGWAIVSESVVTGIVEATATTRVWGFKDDVVIRVSPHQCGAAIDLHSVSRVGQSDLGANAKRIERYLEEFRQRLP